MSVISYDQAGQLFPGYRVADWQIFTKLTGLFGTGPISPDTYQAARRKSVIDCVREDLNNLMRRQHERVGQEEARRLGRAASPDGRHDRPGAMHRRHRDASLA